MEKPTLTVFANFRINNEERYQRMKDSSESFKDISAQKWVINVRGSYALKTLFFLREELGEKLYPHMIESEKGWFYDTRDMLFQIDTDLVFFWIEDHINMVDVQKYENILTEMIDNNVDHLIYSWWHNTTKKTYSTIKATETVNMNIYKMNINNVESIEKYLGSIFYIITATSILNVNYFKKIITSSHPRLKRWDKKTPFDFEKISKDKEFLDFNTAVPKYELFANIDDDHDNKGYSLISRGEYKSTMTRESIKDIEFNTSRSKFYFLRNILPEFLYVELSKFYTLLKRVYYTIK